MIEISKFAHPDYLTHLPDYEQIRDCFRGERAIKGAGVKYLPRLSAQSEGDYENYKRRALFFPITGKTCTSMVGMATAKPPKVSCPDIMKPYFQDTEFGFQFTEFYVSIFTEVVLMGRYGVLIDAPAETAGNPTLVPYLAENVMWWKVDSKSGRLIGILFREIVLQETGDNQFGTKQVIRYRHCYVGADDLYHVMVLDDDLQPTGPEITPTFSGNPIDFIPFVPFGSSGVHMQVDKPPMQDISTINVSHYLTSADLEWGRHIVGLPTPVVSGVDTGTTLKIGGTAAWMLPAPEAKAYYLEFLGQGLQSLEKAMTEKVGLMASISARMVDSSTRGSEAAETVRLRYMSESASLLHIVSSVENGCNILYNMLSTLMKAGGEVLVAFSREIMGATLTFKDLEVLFEAYLNHSLSRESLLYNIRRLDAADPSRTDAQELSAIADPPPRLDPNKQPAAAKPGAPAPSPKKD